MTPMLEVGTVLQVSIKGTWHVGRMVWSAPPRFGLLFIRSLSEENHLWADAAEIGPKPGSCGRPIS